MAIKTTLFSIQVVVISEWYLVLRRDIQIVATNATAFQCCYSNP